MKLRITLLGLLLTCGAPVAVYAAGAAAVPFDHFTTGFELDGLHRNVDCEACHRNGVFKGTPRLCAGCHDGSNRIASTAKTPRHMLTTRCARRAIRLTPVGRQCQSSTMKKWWVPVSRVTTAPMRRENRLRIRRRQMTAVRATTRSPGLRSRGSITPESLTGVTDATTA